MTDAQPAFYDAYLAILHAELLPAMGCTEPIAVAFAAAKARSVLGCMPERAEIRCSANIVKNVKGVTVPNTAGMRGIRVAAIAGIVGGNAQAELEVLQSVTEIHRLEIQRLLDDGFCTPVLAKGIEGLYVEAIVSSGEQSAEVIITQSHNNISSIKKNGVLVVQPVPATVETGKAGQRAGYDLLNIRDIVKFAETVALDEIDDLLDRQIRLNSAISQEGLTKKYGVSVGQTILEHEGDGVRSRARAYAAAGSDARMGGCAFPVVINSGSGNQGITVSLPVIEYARELKVDHEKLLRALVISNLVSLEQKEYIGKLSAYCGAVSAAVGSGAAITYLHGGGYDKIAMTITNTIATAGGVFCDGAKSSCAAKIATAVSAAITGHEMSMKNRCFSPGEGLVGSDVEKTIRNIGLVGSVGMHSTDIQIIKIMLEE